MTREEREQALEWFKNRPVTMSGAKKMYELAIAALEQPEPCEDAVSRKMVMDAITASTPYCVVPDDYHISVVDMEFRISTLPSVQPEIKPIDYQDCANAMLRMWMDEVVTDGEYNRIMDKLNAFWRTRNERSD